LEAILYQDDKVISWPSGHSGRFRFKILHCFYICKVVGFVQLFRAET